METRGKRPNGQHHGDLRHALEQAALELMAAKGVGGFTLAEASRRAGVSVAAPYKHFADRDALLAALVLRAYQDQRERYRAAMGSVADPVEQLAAFAAAYVRFAIEQRALFELTFAAGLDKRRYPELVTAGADLLAVLDAPARALRDDDQQARGLVLSVAACAHGHAVFLLEGVLGGVVEQACRHAAENARRLAAPAVRE
ncbi:TetR/AcrR family transcriptional regulator [Nocardia noduli]|uniref:TetR/AcrR family transcriptional regulator n=1 Tax=Nocardia noduli TaxID=2815722 RepID=UPI001C219C87|nr:TetR/AcrR family transcriptional regulator [Nocardia noduli]